MNQDFKTQYTHGLASLDAIDYFIEEWHEKADDNVSVAQYLGLTDAEYEAFLQDGIVTEGKFKAMLDAETEALRQKYCDVTIGELVSRVNEAIAADKAEGNVYEKTYQSGFARCMDEILGVFNVYLSAYKLHVEYFVDNSTIRITARCEEDHPLVKLGFVRSSATVGYLLTLKVRKRKTQITRNLRNPPQTITTDTIAISHVELGENYENVGGNNVAKEVESSSKVIWKTYEGYFDAVKTIVETSKALGADKTKALLDAVTTLENMSRSRNTNAFFMNKLYDPSWRDSAMEVRNKNMCVPAEKKAEDELGSYTVNIKETLEKQVSIDAESSDDALRIAEQNWKNAEYVLDGECFTGVEYTIVREDK